MSNLYWEMRARRAEAKLAQIEGMTKQQNFNNRSLAAAIRQVIRDADQEGSGHD